MLSTAVSRSKCQGKISAVCVMCDGLFRRGCRSAGSVPGSVAVLLPAQALRCIQAAATIAHLCN